MHKFSLILIIVLLISFVSAIDYSQIQDHDKSKFLYNCLDYTSGLDFCYKLKYDKTFCQDITNPNSCFLNLDRLPREGESITLWPKIEIWHAPKNYSANLVLLYYFTDPSGVASQPRYMYITNAQIKEDASLNLSGIWVDSSFPGYWKLNTKLISNNLSENYIWTENLGQKISESYFPNKETIHILSYSEYNNERLSWLMLIVMLIALIISIIPVYRDFKRQRGLLKALYCELNAISSNETVIKIKNHKDKTKGNLQWFKELFGYGLKPGHNIWKLNSKMYVCELNSSIRWRKTNDLKKALIHISQKISLVENYVLEHYQINKRNKSLRKPILEIFNETIELVNNTKKLLEEDFKIK